MAKKKIPQFETLDEAVAFWETHSFADYVDDTEPVEIQIDLPPKRERVEITLTAPVARQVQSLDYARAVQRRATTMVLPTNVTLPNQRSGK